MAAQDLLITALMERHGASQAAIARATGLSIQRVNNYVRHRRVMDVDAVLAACDDLGWEPAPVVLGHCAETGETPRVAAFWRSRLAA